jgi:hypothetical protein
MKQGLHEHLCAECDKRFICLRHPLGCAKPFLTPCPPCRGIDPELSVTDNKLKAEMVRRLAKENVKDKQR